MEKLTWMKRAKVIRSELSTRKQWMSEGGHYAIDFAKYVHPDLSPVWRMMVRCDGGGLVVASHHRTRNAAENAANNHRRAKRSD